MGYFKNLFKGLIKDSKEKKEKYSNDEYSPTLIKEAPRT